jgi:2-iminobutanoate/2-iminopropanoate deaminase
MRPEVIHVPGFSELVAKMGVPLSPVTRGAGLVFVSGTPPIDLETGSIVKGDIEVQTEAANASAGAHVRSRSILAHGV